MSYFLIYKSGLSNIKENAGSYFKELDYKIQIEYRNNYFTFLSFTKQSKRFSEISGNTSKFFYYITGTIISKGQNLSQTIINIKNDLTNNEYYSENYYGNYILIKIYSDYIEINTDNYGLNNIFYTFDKNIISNSLLSILHSKKNNFSINRLSLIENLVTGSLIGEDTLFNEIKKFEKSSFNNSDTLKILTSRETPPVKLKSNAEAIEFATNKLKEYFKNIKNYSNDLGVDLGITGGFDSRLLMSISKDYISNIQYHTHYRKNKDNEITIAEKLTKTIKKELIQEKVIYPLEKSESDLINTLNKCLFYNDGQTRVHCFFIEEYNTEEYKLKLLKDKNISMTGINGEIFRNNIFMTASKWKSDYFIKYYLNGYLNDFCIEDKKIEQKYLNNLRNKIFLKLDKNKSDDNFSFFEIKKFIGEVYPSGKTNIRMNSENQICYTINPYLEKELIESSLSVIPFLGNSDKFQSKLINYFSKDLANIETDYGYNLIEGETFKIKLKRRLRNFIPPKYQIRFIHNSSRSNNSINYYNDLLIKFKILRQITDMIKFLLPEINWGKLIKNPDLMLNLFSVSYFIYYCKTNEILEND